VTAGFSPSASDQARLAASDVVVAWCLRNAARHLRLRNVEQAGLIAHVAAATAAELGQSSLCSAPLETLLLEIGRAIDGSPGADAPRPRDRWLHVFTMTSSIGGHTALARRWISRNPGRRVHDIVLTGQALAAADPALTVAVQASGGTVRSLADVDSLVGRTHALRTLAASADVVVLHTHMWDVLPTLAFAHPGGPPVLLMNHADHAFWVGVAVADAVIDFRDSGAALTERLRAPRGMRRLPVPLDERAALPRDRAALAGRLPSRALDRRTLLLTIGRASKYQSLRALDFRATASRIVQALDDCTLVAVGPPADDPLWQALGRETDGRAVAVGEDANLAPWWSAADLYLEGFPIGSYTALLETVQAGRAVVRKPWLTSPDLLPVDTGALAAAVPPPDADAYVAEALRLSRDPSARDAQVATLRPAVVAVHAGSRWDAALRELEDSLPAAHAVGFGGAPGPMPPDLRAYVAGVTAGRITTPALDYAEAAAANQRVGLRRDIELMSALRAFAQ
jgi:hypothetical protein